jgi:DNA-nicking Smr family endonuclease
MRRTTPEERALFVAVLEGREPVKRPPAKKAPPKQVPAKTKAPSSKSPSGLDANTARRLRRGEISPAAKLDLHGLTEAAAYRALNSFILAAYKRGDRLVLVVTGKGGASPDPERKRGILKSMVPRWLEEASLSRLIAERRWAHIRHGGEGALYVYLKKARSSRA